MTTAIMKNNASGAAAMAGVPMNSVSKANSSQPNAPVSAGTTPTPPLNKTYDDEMPKLPVMFPTSSDLDPVFTKRVVSVVGAPFASGQELGGVDKAPAALQGAGLKKVVNQLGWDYVERGIIDFDKEGEGKNGEDHASNCHNGNEYYTNIKNCKVAGDACRRIHDEVLSALQSKHLTVTIGGDHSIATGSITAVKRQYPDVAILWIDAHGDCNTPTTSPSGNYHGMPAAHVMGWFEKRAEGFEWLEDAPPLKEDRIAFVGLRDLDLGERNLMIEKGVPCFTMYHIDRYGIGKVVESALNSIDPYGRRPLHLSLDIDACDPSVAPGTGTKARGGLSYREIQYICEAVAETRRLVSMDLVEINVDLDAESDQLHGDQLPINTTAPQTVRLGVELIASVLGKCIM